MSQQSLRVCSFESRREQEIGELLRRRGAAPFVAPSMQEVPLEDNREVFDFAERLFAGEIDVMIFLTGVGARTLMNVLETRYERHQVLDALRGCRTVVRGPKPTAVLREWKLRIDHRAPEPNTWRELIGVLDAAHVPLSGKTVAVQEYGIPNHELYEALRERGAEVLPVTVYRWALPDDVAPLEEAVQKTVGDEFDVLMFTSAQQVRNVLTVAGRLGLGDEFRSAARRCVIASIGPTASETLREEGLPPDLEPSHPKMGTLVRETCEQAPGLLRERRRQPASSG